MTRYGKTSHLSLVDVMQKSENFFGPKGLGLDIKEHTVARAAYEGGGGYVVVAMTPATQGTEVEVDSREWDYQVEQFLTKI